MSISTVATGDGASDDYLKKVVKYIPTEAIAIYVAVLALFDPIKRLVDTEGKELPLHMSDFGSRWTMFYAMAVATPMLCLLIFAYRARPGTSGPSTLRWDKWLYTSVIAVVGLAVWASALPDSPAWDVEFWKAGIAGVALLVFSLIVPMIASLLKLDEFN